MFNAKVGKKCTSKEKENISHCDYSYLLDGIILHIQWAKLLSSQQAQSVPAQNVGSAQTVCIDCVHCSLLKKLYLFNYYLLYKAFIIVINAITKTPTCSHQTNKHEYIDDCIYNSE